MPIRVGLLTEGHDHLILCAYLAKLLGVPEEEIEPDCPDGTGHGHQYVEATIDRALRRFYNKCAQLAIISMDNDGNLDLQSSGRQEDPRRRRHWLHGKGNQADCRWCLIHEQIERTRPALNWIPNKPAETWPIVIAVPVESIEAWLLTTQAVLSSGTGSLHAEREHRAHFKLRFYGRPAATFEDVQNIALPMVRRLEANDLERLGDHSRSFLDFADQIKTFRDEVTTAPPCW